MPKAETVKLESYTTVVKTDGKPFNIRVSELEVPVEKLIELGKEHVRFIAEQIGRYKASRLALIKEEADSLVRSHVESVKSLINRDLTREEVQRIQNRVYDEKGLNGTIVVDSESLKSRLGIS
jgi:hypothetical protein